MGINQPAPGVGHQGVLFRGANGSLWFLRDDANAPVKLNAAMTKQITAILCAQSQWQNPPVGPPVIAILDPQFGPLEPDGVIHHCATGGSG
jgi:hypothetical protein